MDTQRVSLGCGTLILIAIIVLIFSRGGGVDKGDLRPLEDRLNQIERKLDDVDRKLRDIQDELRRPRPD